ncbi:MAG: MOSC domain-containing protein [Candidatus Competibacterales bacterium]|nr:MOSC domain-containing protein [Candidatus Competibacterales bacterium]
MPVSQDDNPAGRVVGLWRYPVKSMAGEMLEAAEISWHGVAGDRRWAFVREGVVQSGFPWFTIRQRNNMAHYRPSFVDATQPDRSRTIVRTPSGESFDVTDPALAEELNPDGVRLIKQNRGVFDTFPLSLITTQTIKTLGDMVNLQLDVRRFRPNIVVDAAGSEPFPEDGWVGRTLRIGGVRMRVDRRDGRCVVITVDPDTSERKPEIFRAVKENREGCLGVYGSTVEPGQVLVGDSVLLEDR